jgi:hypothetical protein
MIEANSTIEISESTLENSWTFANSWTYTNIHVNDPYSFTIVPKYEGSYRIGGNGGLSVSLEKKPNWFHRTMMKLCLGWEWHDGSPF